MKPTHLLFVALAGTALAGCGGPNQIIARDPIPQPPPGYRVACASTRLILNGVYSSCDPVTTAVVVERRTVVVRPPAATRRVVKD